MNPSRRLLLNALATVPLAAVALGAGCSQPYEWKTSNVTGKFPDLKLQLTDENGEQVSEADFSDTVNMLFFGFTSCPDVCPTTLARLSRVMDELEPAQRRQVRVLFVSVDPGRDTRSRLAEYTDSFGERFVGMTADIPTLRQLTKRYYTTFSYGEPDANGDYEVLHNGSVLVFDRDGKARLRLTASEAGGGPSDSVDAIVSDLEALLSS